MVSMQVFITFQSYYSLIFIKIMLCIILLKIYFNPIIVLFSSISLHQPFTTHTNISILLQSYFHLLFHYSNYQLLLNFNPIIVLFSSFPILFEVVNSDISILLQSYFHLAHSRSANAFTSSFQSYYSLIFIKMFKANCRISFNLISILLQSYFHLD